MAESYYAKIYKEDDIKHVIKVLEKLDPCSDWLWIEGEGTFSRVDELKLFKGLILGWLKRGV